MARLFGATDAIGSRGEEAIAAVKEMTQDENVDRVYQTQLLRQYPELVVLNRIVYLPLP